MAKIKPSKLQHVPTSKVEGNPHNPRYLFDRGPMDILEKSIKESGILNPLLIYERKKDGQLIILDGERRWICAQKLNLKTVPANIIEEPNLVTNLLTMFNIHNVREPWELMPTALKLEIIMRETKSTSEAILAKLTGLSKANVNRCKILLSFQKKYQDQMIAKDPSQRIKADFFIELHPVLNLIQKRLPNVNAKYTRDQLIEILLEKYKKKIITNVVHLRDVATVIRSLNKGFPLDKVEEIIFNLIESDVFDLKKQQKPIDRLYDSIYYKKTLIELTEDLALFEVEKMKFDEELFGAFSKLRKMLNEKIEQMEKLR